MNKALTPKFLSKINVHTLLAFAAMVLMVYILDIGCMVKYLFGVPCPGCGLTRAWLAVFRGDFSAAFAWHPLFWAAPVFIIWGVLYNGAVFKKRIYNNILWYGALTIYIGVYIIRMIYLFPLTPPMDYNNNAIFVWCFKYIAQLFI